MSKFVAVVAMIAACFASPSAEAILSKLPYGDSMQIVVSDDLPPLANGDWTAAHVDWGSDEIHIAPTVLTDDWRSAFGPSTDRLSYLVAHEWAHVMQSRRWNVYGPKVPGYVTDPFLRNAPGWMAIVYASPDPSIPWWEVHADCVAQVLSGYSVMGYYVGEQGCSQVQLSDALAPLLNIGTADGS